MEYHIELYRDGDCGRGWYRHDWTAWRDFAFTSLRQCMAHWSGAARGRIITSTGKVIATQER